MNPIRPGLPAQVQPAATPRAPETARAAAQRAFFEMAAGKASALRAAAPAAASLASEATPATGGLGEISAPGAAPTRPLRPGSLLDIKV